MDDIYRYAMQEQIAALEEELQEIERLLQQHEHMPTLLYRALERCMQLLIEACIGIAKQTLKGQNQHVPSEARQVLEKLKAEGLDSSGIPWRQVIGMRNAIVHDYLNLDRDLVADVIRQGHYKALLAFAKEKLTAP